MDEDIVIPIAFFITVIIISIGFPLVRAFTKRLERRQDYPPTMGDTSARLERIEHAIDAMAVEVERISEGQRFVTRLMTDRSEERAPLPGRASQREA